MRRLTLIAPLSGWAAPLEETPDPVFAGGMMGDGVAIDPTGEAMFAPCDGLVLKVHPAGHAVTLRADNGADILVHLGIDTVALNGEGFTRHISEGLRVSAGDRLVSFDLDRLACRAPSLMSPILVTNTEAFQLRVLRSGCEVAAGDPLIELAPAANAPASVSVDGGRVVRRARVTHPHGLHARPAALISAEAKRAVGDVELRLGEARANARSPVALMALGVAAGDEVEVEATGPGAEGIVAAVLEAIARINATPVEAPPPLVASPTPSSDGRLRGVRAAPGLAVGPVWRRAVAEPPLEAASAGEAAESRVLDAAVGATVAELTSRRDRLAGEARAIVEAHLALLEDPELIAAARRGLSSGASAGCAWRDAAQAYVGVLRRTGDPRLVERAADLKDLEQQVLWRLAGRAPEVPAPPPGAILVADDLLPSELIELTDAQLAGLATAGGGPTSHVAVLAATRGLPAVVALGPSALALSQGVTVILDADGAILDPSPTPERLVAAKAEISARAARQAEALTAAGEPGRLSDGTRIEVLANVGTMADADLAARSGAEGCGLLRTEFLFEGRNTAPLEAEQLAAYQAISDTLAGKPLVVRTLDVGGDKPAPYLALPPEENPALGLRGVRVSLARPDLLRTQLRAILQVDGDRRIMVPMVASVAELAAVRAILRAEADALGRPAPPLGVMVETPAAAASVDLLAGVAEFISLGTNDLAQYALAMDRGNPAVAAEVDALHPAVLRLIRLACEAAASAGLPVSVCGGLASDPQAAPILIGLGAHTLSAAPAAIPTLKAALAGFDLAAAKDLATRACRQTSAAEVRALSPKPVRRARSRARRRASA